MRPSPDRAPLRPLQRTLPSRTAALAPADAREAVVTVHLAPDLRALAEDAAIASGLRVVGVRHLQAACAALASHVCVAVVADDRLPSWDRAVLEEHATRHGAGVTWIDAARADYDAFDEIVKTALGGRRAPVERRRAWAS